MSDVASTTSPPAPRRVLFVDHTAMLGGGEIALLNLVRHLDRSRYAPIVALFSDGPLREKLVETGAETHVLLLAPDVLNTRKDTLGGSTLLKGKQVWKTLKFTWAFRRFIRDHNIDIVHTNSLKADIIGGIAAKLARRKLIWHVRDRIETDYLPSIVVRVFRWMARKLPDSVIANSAATLKTVSPTKLERSAAIHSGVDFGNRVSIVHDGTFERYNAAGGGGRSSMPLIGLVGRISPWKGQHVFIRAAKQVLEKYPDAKFQIIGSAMFDEAEYEAYIRDKVVRLAIDSSVEFTGFRSDVPDLIAKLDILVHASVVGEPFGQVVIEGMAAARPVVATNGGGVPEIVRDGVTGILVPMGDADAMAAAIMRLLADPVAADAMGRAGRERVRDHFTIQSTARKVEHLYDELLAR